MGNKPTNLLAVDEVYVVRNAFNEVLHGKYPCEYLKKIVHDKVDHYKEWEVDNGGYYGRNVEVTWEDGYKCLKVNILLRYKTEKCHETNWLVAFCIVCHPNGKEALLLHAPEENLYADKKLQAHDPLCRITNLYHPHHEEEYIECDSVVNIYGAENACLDFLSYLCDTLKKFVLKCKWGRKVLVIDAFDNPPVALTEIPEKCFIKGSATGGFEFPIVLDYECVKKFYHKCFFFQKCDPADLVVKTKKFEIYFVCQREQLSVFYGTNDNDDLPKCWKRIVEACDFQPLIETTEVNYFEQFYVSTEYECVRELFCCLRCDVFFKECEKIGWFCEKKYCHKKKEVKKKHFDCKTVTWKNDCRPDFAKTFAANLTGDQEIPQVNTKACGFAKMILNGDQENLYYKVKVKHLSSRIASAHFHDGKAGTNGPVLKPLNPFFRKGNYCVSVGCWSKDDPEYPLTGLVVAKLLSGDVYINIHTENYPSGEVRGQIFVHQFKKKDHKAKCLKWIEYKKKYDHWGARHCMVPPVYEEEEEEEHEEEYPIEPWALEWDHKWLKDYKCCGKRHHEKEDYYEDSSDDESYGNHEKKEHEKKCCKKEHEEKEHEHEKKEHEHEKKEHEHEKKCCKKEHEEKEHEHGKKEHEHEKKEHGKKEHGKKEHGKKEHEHDSEDTNYFDGCPKIVIKKPCERGNVDCKFKLKVNIKNWDQKWAWFWDDCFVGKADVCDTEVKFVVPKSKKGWHKVKVALVKNYWKPGKYTKFTFENFVYLTEDCCYEQKYNEDCCNKQPCKEENSCKHEQPYKKHHVIYEDNHDSYGNRGEVYYDE